MWMMYTLNKHPFQKDDSAWNRAEEERREVGSSLVTGGRILETF